MTKADDSLDARLEGMGHLTGAEIRALWARSLQIGDIIRAAGHDPHDPHAQMLKLNELAQQMIDMPKWVFSADANSRHLK